MAHFGKLVRSLRNQARMTQDDLAHATGMSRSAIQFLEIRERKTKRFRTTEKLAKALGVTVETLDTDNPGGERLPIHIPASVFTALEPYASRDGRTIEEVATALLSQWLAQQEPVKKVKKGIAGAVVTRSKPRGTVKRAARGGGGRLWAETP